MGTINKTKTDTSHTNFMGAPSYDIKNPIVRLRNMAASMFFGEPMYYKKAEDKKLPSPTLRSTHSYIPRLADILGASPFSESAWAGLSPQESMEKAIDAALDFDPEKTLALAVELRDMHNIRVTPQVIFVRAAMHKKVHGTNLLHTYGPQVLVRMDEPATQLAYFLSAYGRKIPSRLKRAWARRLEKATEFELAKYRQESREVKLTDVVSLTHAFSPAIDKLMKGQLKLGSDNETWESARSAGKSWTEAAESMGHMALLRNLRNLHEAKALTGDLLQKLVNGVEKGRQLPFRYWSAYQAVKEAGGGGKVLDAIEECLERSIKNVPHLNGRSLVLTDNSGSAQGAYTSSLGKVTVATIGNLMGIITAKASDEGVVGVFGDRLHEEQIRQKSSIFDTLHRLTQVAANIGGSTEHGIWLALRQAIDKKEHWDHLFVYSDMQAGHGGLYGVGRLSSLAVGSHYVDVPSLIREYRQKVNSKVLVYLVQIAGYEDTIIPEYYDRTFILGGWSANILKFAGHMQDQYGKQ